MMPRDVRTNSCALNSASSLWICAVSAGWAIASVSAARVKLPWSAISTK
jgi:hypothetical protein